MNEVNQTNETDADDGWLDGEEDPGLSPAPQMPPEWRGPATPPPQRAEGARPQAVPASEHHAAHLQETSGSAYLYCTMSQVFREVGPESYKLYLLKVLEDAGNPTDPIERMLIEQIVLAHHNTGRLHVRAASADHLEEARVYIGAAALMTGEFRRSVATLKSYREPTRTPARKSDGADRDAKAGREGLGGELVSNTGGEADEGTIPLPEPLEGRGGTEESGQAARAKRRRA